MCGGVCVCVNNVTCLTLPQAKIILNGNITKENDMKERERNRLCNILNGLCTSINVEWSAFIYNAFMINGLFERLTICAPQSPIHTHTSRLV